MVDCLFKYCPSIAVATQRSATVRSTRNASKRPNRYSAALLRSFEYDFEPSVGQNASLVNFNSRSVSEVMVRFSVGSPTRFANVLACISTLRCLFRPANISRSRR